MDLLIIFRGSRAGFLNCFRVVLPFILILITFSAHSQTPRTISLGVFDLSSSLLVEHAEDDNIYRSASSPVSTSVTTLTPSFELSFDNGVSGFNFIYSLEDASFSDRESEDYTDQLIDVALGSIFADLHRIDLGYVFADDHDRRDSDAPSGNIIDTTIDPGRLDEFEDNEFELAYTLGTEESLVTLRLSGSEFEREYKTNLADTAEFNREESSLGSVLGWNVSQDLILNLTYIDTEITYSNNPSRDGDESIYALGVVWSPLETTTFEANVGVTERLASVSGDEVSNNYWDVSLTWNIYSYSTLTLLTSSFVEEDTTGDGAYTLREELGFTWVHEWTDLLETELSYVDGSIDYIGGDRVDNSERTFFRLGYDFRRWLNLGFFYENAVRNSNTITVSTEDYDQEIFGVSALFQL